MTGVRLRPWVPPATVVAVVVAYSLVATQFDPYTTAMRVATALPCAVVAAAARTSRRPHPRPDGWPGAWRVGLAVWAVLIAAVILFQLGLYLSQPRSAYPTLSSLASDAFESRPVRTAAFAAWLWVGWYLVER